ncbi:MAG: DUF3467 domain-containing protein [Acidobacteria bacterium]|nr:DUF3467 domain-containing protein [Acidobacteriota bacterium]
MDSKDKKSEEKQEEGKILTQRVSATPHLGFADSTLVMTSKFDIKIYFGVSVPTQEGVGEVQYHTIMSMSPQLAKAVSKSLAKATADYERDYMLLKMNDEK